MPNFTNRHRIHDAIARAVVFDPYERRGDISITGLTRPPQAGYLEMVHDHEIDVDVSDRLWALLGQSVHAVLARAQLDEALQEEPLSMEVEGWTVTGRPDLWQALVLTDFKVTSVWAFLLGDKQEWEEQLNWYALLYRHAGFEVERIEVAGILRDWNKRTYESRRNEPNNDYPPSPFMRKEIPLWSFDEAMERLVKRVREHQQARTGNPRECTADERWAKPTRYALMRPGQKKAVKLFDTVEDARLFAVGKPGLALETRPGDATVRCRDWCDAAAFCPQYERLRGEALAV